MQVSDIIYSKLHKQSHKIEKETCQLRNILLDSEFLIATEIWKPRFVEREIFSISHYISKNISSSTFCSFSFCLYRIKSSNKKLRRIDFLI